MSRNLKRYLLLHLDLDESETEEEERRIFSEIEEARMEISEIEFDLVNAIWSYQIKNYDNLE